MVENIIQIKTGMTIYVDVSVETWKNIMCTKKITCDEIIEETKLLQ